MISSTTTPKPSRDPLQAQIEYIGANMVDREQMALIMRDAVAEGIRAAVSDPKLWAAAGEAMQQRAASATGGWLIGGIRSALSRLGWLVFIGLGIYMVGGWAALGAAWKALTAGGAP
jgi:hypothetical protein